VDKVKSGNGGYLCRTTFPVFYVSMSDLPEDGDMYYGHQQRNQNADEKKKEESKTFFVFK